METVLFQEGRYKITSEKVDKMPPRWEPISALVGFVVYLLFLGECAMYALTNKDISFGGFIVIFILLIFVAIIIVAVHDFITGKYTKCGIEVRLSKRNSWWYDYNRIAGVCFQLSGDSDKDASDVLRIVDGYKQKIVAFNQEALRDHRQELLLKAEHDKRSKECCDLYRGVIEKIKPKTEENCEEC